MVSIGLADKARLIPITRLRAALKKIDIILASPAVSFLPAPRFWLMTMEEPALTTP
ncbi:hypothetical protein D3C81_2281100 [compost metagenome]